MQKVTTCRITRKANEHTLYVGAAEIDPELRTRAYLVKYFCRLAATWIYAQPENTRSLEEIESVFSDEERVKYEFWENGLL